MSRKRKPGEEAAAEEVEDAEEGLQKKVQRVDSNVCVVFIMLHSSLKCETTDDLQFFSLPYNEEFIKGNFAPPGCKSIIHYTDDVDDPLAISKIIKENVKLTSNSSGKTLMERIMRQVRDKFIENHEYKYQGQDSECAQDFEKLKTDGFALQYTPKCSWLSSFVTNTCQVAIKQYELSLEHGKLTDGTMGYGERISISGNPEETQLFKSTSPYDDNITLFFQDGRELQLLQDIHNQSFPNFISRKYPWQRKITPFNLTFTTENLFEFLRQEYPRMQFAFVDGGCSGIMNLSKHAQDEAYKRHGEKPSNYGGKKSIRKSKRRPKRMSNRKSKNRRPRTQKYSR
jgi:hypothetical protein